MSDVSPANSVVPVTPSDSVDLPQGWARGLLVGTSGTAKITDGSGAIVTGVPLQAGYNPIRVQRVWSTGTTAAAIYALY